MATERPVQEYAGGLPALLARARASETLSELCDTEGEILLRGKLRDYAAGEYIFKTGEDVRELFILLEGTTLIDRPNHPADCTLPMRYVSGSMGEVQILTGKPSFVGVLAETDVTTLVLEEKYFWQIMQQCVPVRSAIVSKYTSRIQDFQAVAMEREQMVSIGTLTAGLMHELNNPGTAALRATADLRKKLNNLQELSLKLSSHTDSLEEQQCIHQLLLDVFKPCTKCDLSTLEMSDRAERLAEWLDAKGIQDAWSIGPSLTDAGIDQEQLSCAQNTLDGQKFSDALHWLDALASSMGLLQTVETSMTRITELISAVKTYSSGARGLQDVNVHDTIKAGFMMVKHKIYQRQIQIRKEYDPDLPMVRQYAPAMTQVWTNLLDNAADAVPETGGRILLRTRKDGANIVVEIEDNGRGIPEDVLPHIFDPFYTTKDSGKGTGLGLDIVMRSIKRAGGTLDVESHPGRTVFRVTLPASATSPDATGTTQAQALPAPAR